MPTLRLGGNSFHCIPEIPAGLLLDLADATQTGGLAVISEYRRFVYAAVVEEEQPALKETLNRTVNIVSLDELNNSVGELLLEYVGRPSSPPSVSPVGSPPTTGMPRAMSLDGKAREAAAVSSSDNGAPLTP